MRLFLTSIFIVLIFPKIIFGEIYYDDFIPILSTNKNNLQSKIKEIYKQQFYQIKSRKLVILPTTQDKLQSVYIFLVKDKKVLNQTEEITKSVLEKINLSTKKYNQILPKEMLKDLENFERENLKKILTFDFKDIIDFNNLKNTIDNNNLLISLMSYHYILLLNTNYILYKLNLLGYLEKEKYTEIKNDLENTFQKRIFLSNYDKLIDNLVEFCSKISFKLAAEIEIKDLTENNSKGNNLTFTLRCSNGLVLIFASEEKLLKIKDELKNINNILSVEDVKNKIIDIESGIKGSASFYLPEDEKVVVLQSLSLRAAEILGFIPCIEDLSIKDAQKILKLLNLNVYFFSVENRDVLEGLLPELGEEFIILDGTDKNSLIYLTK